MSRESYRNALLIQHCYSPYRTTQFEKTIKKRQKGPVLAIKGPFGVLGGPDLVPTAPHWPAWVGLMVITYFSRSRSRPPCMLLSLYVCMLVCLYPCIRVDWWEARPPCIRVPGRGRTEWWRHEADEEGGGNLDHLTHIFLSRLLTLWWQWKSQFTSLTASQIQLIFNLVFGLTNRHWTRNNNHNIFQTKSGELF